MGEPLRIKDDRLLSPVKTDYVEALGRATFAFASLEWQVAWSCERIKPGSLDLFREKRLTAGQIAKAFIDLCRNLPRAFPERDEFRRCATPGPSQEARLSGVWAVIEIADLEDAADEVVECGGDLNRLYYAHLAPMWQCT